MKKYREVNDARLHRAYRRAANRLFNHRTDYCTSSSTDAGFITDGDGKAVAQVFVKVIRFDEKRLRERPLTGGLEANL